MFFASVTIGAGYVQSPPTPVTAGRSERFSLMRMGEAFEMDGKKASGVLVES